MSSTKLFDLVFNNFVRALTDSSQRENQTLRGDEGVGDLRGDEGACSGNCATKAHVLGATEIIMTDAVLKLFLC